MVDIGKKKVGSCDVDIDQTADSLIAVITDLENEDWDSLAVDGDNFYAAFDLVLKQCTDM